MAYNLSLIIEFKNFPKIGRLFKPSNLPYYLIKEDITAYYYDIRDFNEVILDKLVSSFKRSF